MYTIYLCIRLTSTSISESCIIVFNQFEQPILKYWRFSHYKKHGFDNCTQQFKFRWIVWTKAGIQMHKVYLKSFLCKSQSHICSKLVLRSSGHSINHHHSFQQIHKHWNIRKVMLFVTCNSGQIEAWWLWSSVEAWANLSFRDTLVYPAVSGAMWNIECWIVNSRSFSRLIIFSNNKVVIL